MLARFAVATLLAALSLPHSAAVGQAGSLDVRAVPAVFKAGSDVAVQVTINSPRAYTKGRLDLIVTAGKTVSIKHNDKIAPVFIGAVVPNKTMPPVTFPPVKAPADGSTLRFTVELYEGNDAPIGENALLRGSRVYVNECQGGGEQSNKKLNVRCAYAELTAHAKSPR